MSIWKDLVNGEAKRTPSQPQRININMNTLYKTAKESLDTVNALNLDDTYLEMLMDNIVFEASEEHKDVAKDIYNRGMDAIKDLYVGDLIAKGKSYHVMVAMVIAEFDMEYDDAWMLVNEMLPETSS